MRFTDLHEESGLAAKPSNAGIHGNHKNYISFFPRQAGDSEMLKCTNTLSLPGCLILNRARLFLPAVVSLFSVAYTCNLEIPLVTFPPDRNSILSLHDFPFPTSDSFPGKCLYCCVFAYFPL